MTVPLRSLVLFGLLMRCVASMGQFGVGGTVYPFGGSAEMHAADMDVDGDKDLFGVFNGHHLKWFDNTDGAGEFSPAIAIQTIDGDCHQHLLADVDDDLDPDILFVSNNADGVTILFNDGAGNFPTGTFLASPAHPEALACADLNGDGRQDLLVSLWFPGGAGLGIFFGADEGFGAFVPFPELHDGSPSVSLVTGDLDLSGGTDVVLRAENDVLMLAKNPLGDGTSWEVDTLPLPDGPPSYPYRDPQLLDVDGDGDLDLAESRGPAVHWLRNDMDEGGVLAFFENVVESWVSSGNGVFGASACGTGAAVVFVPQNPALPVKWNSYLPLLQGFAYSNDLPALPRGQNLILADLDGDGREDLVMNQANGVSWYRNSLTVPVDPLILPEIDTLCVAGAPVTMPAVEPAGGRWYGDQIANGLLFRSNLGVTMDLPVVHAVYADQGCPMAEASSIRLIERPVFTALVPPVICSADAPVQLTSEPADVLWYGLDGSSVIDPSIWNGGYIVCEFTDTTGTVCAAVEGPIQRWNSLPAEITPAGPFCTGDQIQTITVAAAPPFNVTWSGPISGSDLTSTLFDPAQGAGEYEIILFVEPYGPNQCANSDTLHLSVGATPEIAILPSAPYCAEGAPIPLQGASPEGGVWSGEGVSEGSLDPTLLGPGLHLVSYFILSDDGCGAQAATSIELVSMATVDWGSADLLFCADDDPIQFTAAPEGGSWEAPLSNEGVLDPASQSPGFIQVSYSYTDPRGCVLTNAQIVVEVGAPKVVEIAPVGDLCTDSPPFDLVGSGSGQWSGAVSGEGASVQIDPGLLGPGSWSVTLTLSPIDECPGSATREFIVDVCTGVEEIPGVEPFITPNPFNGTTNLMMPWDGPIDLVVFDASGRAVRASGSPSSDGRRTVVDLTGCPDGLYTIQVFSGGRYYHLRAVQEN